MARRQRRKEKKPAVDPMVAWRRDIRGIGVWTVISVAAAGGVAWIVNLLG
ncbi:hypothetical protein CLV97_11641 [Planifilum fimeticola]|jgi:hypothetical protein|uniref:Uncharacterized protein n=1 Tax=Planifilum fimeticola TaxID=201975 RepID=A0A2T0LDQ4_9BACL|nr:hypothetical protein [Planifilum fimeticola]PRX40158.1 hypothetical protein CLV97_11641 [Planifilum fimeticola]